MVWLTEKYPSLLERFSDGHSIYGSQETSCIYRKGFIMFLSYDHHKSTLMKTYPLAYCPPGSICGGLSISEGVAPGYYLVVPSRHRSACGVQSVVKKKLPEDGGVLFLFSSQRISLANKETGGTTCQ